MNIQNLGRVNTEMALFSGQATQPEGFGAVQIFKTDGLVFVDIIVRL